MCFTWALNEDTLRRRQYGHPCHCASEIPVGESFLQQVKELVGAFNKATYVSLQNAHGIFSLVVTTANSEHVFHGTSLAMALAKAVTSRKNPRLEKRDRR